MSVEIRRDAWKIAPHSIDGLAHRRPFAARGTRFGRECKVERLLISIWRSVIDPMRQENRPGFRISNRRDEPRCNLGKGAARVTNARLAVERPLLAERALFLQHDGRPAAFTNATSDRIR